MCLFTNIVYARNVFLNGIDISGASSQELKNVDIHINEKGDIFITAPHYEVHEEDTYLPLSSYLGKGPDGLSHKPPQALPPHLQNNGATRKLTTPGMVMKKKEEEKDKTTPVSLAPTIQDPPVESLTPAPLEKPGSKFLP